MTQLLTVLIVLGSACIIGWGIPLSRLFDAFQPLNVALSITIAALFVRLNRGMPTLEWSNLDPTKRSELTRRIVDLSREYGWIVAINAAALFIIMALIVVGKEEIDRHWPAGVQRVVAGIIAGLVVLGVLRMAYVVWRDQDIVKLQKHLIDGSAARDIGENEAKKSAEKIAEIRSVGLRKVPSTDPKAWGE